MSTDSAPPATPHAAPGWHTLTWVLLPPLAVVLLRAALQTPPDGDWQPLRVAAQVTSAHQAIWVAAQPFLWAVLALLSLAVGLRLALRRWGWTRLRRPLLVLWVLLWLGVGTASVARHLNQTGRQPLPTQQARVLLAGDVAPSARRPGGAQVYLALSGDTVPPCTPWRWACPPRHLP